MIRVYALIAQKLSPVQNNRYIWVIERVPVIFAQWIPAVGTPGHRAYCRPSSTPTHCARILFRSHLAGDRLAYSTTSTSALTLYISLWTNLCRGEFEGYTWGIPFLKFWFRWGTTGSPKGPKNKQHLSEAVLYSLLTLRQQFSKSSLWRLVPKDWCHKPRVSQQFHQYFCSVGLMGKH